MDIEDLKERVCTVIDAWYDNQPVVSPEFPETTLNKSMVGSILDASPEALAAMGGNTMLSPLPNTRVVRTKSSADRVYLIDETKKTRQWVTNPQVLDSLGFTMADVKEISDDEMLKYQQDQAIYRVA